MPNNNDPKDPKEVPQHNPEEVPHPKRPPEVFPPDEPTDPDIPMEDPDIIPDEAPFEPPPMEVPPPGEGPY
jgi:hypothetical protein